jgi:hypothetical protein
MADVRTPAHGSEARLRTSLMTMNLSGLEEALREYAFDNDEEPSHCWDLYVNALGVRVNAAAKASHVGQDDAFADATNLVRHLIDTGFIMQFGSLAATATDEDGGEWRGCIVDAHFRPAV